MTIRVMAFACAIVLAAGPALAKDIETIPLADPVVMSHPTERAPGDQCDRGHSGSYWTIDSWFTGAESYAVYCDPTDCPDCSGGWRPLSVTIYLYWENQNSCALTVHAEILEADLREPSNPTPGTQVVSASAQMTAGPFSPAGLWAVTIDLPEDCQAFSEPFFASVVFEDACDEPPQLVTDAGPCNSSASWNDWGIGWDELCTYGFPGNLSIYATLECLGSSPVHDASWTTIKSLYR